MPIYKRKNSPVWWIDFTTPNGQRIRCSAKTTVKRQAQEYHDKLKAECWNNDILEKSPEHYFDEALLLFLKDSEHQRRLDSKKSHARYFRERFGGRKLRSLTTEELVNAIPIESMDGKKPLTPATQNRYRSTILRILSLAHKAGWIDKIPYIPRKQEPKVRISWITKEQARDFIRPLKIRLDEECLLICLTDRGKNERNSQFNVG